MISFSLYHRPWGLWKQLLDRVERPITYFDPSKHGKANLHNPMLTTLVDFCERAVEAVLPLRSNTPSDRNCLVIRYDADRDSAARQLVSFKPPAATSLLPPLDPSAVSESISSIGSPLVSVLQSIAPFKNLFDELAKVSLEI